MIEKEIIDKLKKEKGELYFGELGFDDKSGASHSVEFLFRKPLVADIEAYQKMSQKSGSVAQENLLRGLIVYPDANAIMAEIKDYPCAIADFVDGEITPFFGSNIRRGSRKV
jgi:hypothetical protein